MTFMKARFAQQYREQVRKHTRNAMRQKAEQGYVTGGTVFGYDERACRKGPDDTSCAQSRSRRGPGHL